MNSRENIAKHLKAAKVDVLFERLVAHLANDDAMVYEPRGLFNKGIKTDIGKISRKHGKLFAEINRPGLYELLPKGLFHNKLDDSNDKTEFINQVEEERKNARRLFLPFDNVFLAASADLERERLKHYQNTFDPEITFELLIFFNVFHIFPPFMVFKLLLYEAIAYSLSQNRGLMEKEIINKIISQDKELSLRQIVVNALEACQGNSAVYRVLEIIPYAANSAGSLQSIKRYLSYLVQRKVDLQKCRETKEYNYNREQNKLDNILLLNTNKQTLLTGNSFIETSTFVDVVIMLNKEDDLFTSHVASGLYKHLIHLFFSFFLPFQFDYRLRLDSATEPSFCLMDIDTGLQKQMEYTEQKLQSFFDDSQSITQMERSVKMRDRMFFSEYIKLVCAHIEQGAQQQAYLNINTKL